MKDIRIWLGLIVLFLIAKPGIGEPLNPAAATLGRISGSLRINVEFCFWLLRNHHTALQEENNFI